jgi:hypothetical protein
VGIEKVKVEQMVPSSSYMKQQKHPHLQSLCLSCIIDALQGHDVGTCNIDEELPILFEGELVDLLIQVEPSFQEYVTQN